MTSTATPSIEAHWTAPAQANGGLIAGYKLYIDNAAGGEDTVVFDGSKDRPATYSNIISSSITCGALYTLKVTAVNVAGESDPTIGQIEVGEPSSAPLHPTRTAITALSSLSIAWSDPLQDGCLPILHYIVNRDGVDLAGQIIPSSNSFTDDISAAATYPLGTAITYKIKAVNIAGASAYSVPLVVTVG